MAKAVSSSARFRQRKISVKQTLQVISQSDIPDLEDEQQRELQQIETGVEKGEEEEHHLQAAINASNAASQGAKVEQVYIPTPDASKKWSGDFSKYYPKSFQSPSSYIRLSATVEDTSGCPYCMDERDEEFLKKYNKSKPANDKCTEDEFEMICHKFESMISERQPFLTMDPSQLMPFEELSPLIIQQINDAENDPSSPEFLLASTGSSLYNTKKKSRKSTVTSFKQYGKDIYPHWKERKIERHGKSIFPQPKLEESEKDDSDPYVCFRRREVRQVRKTRRTDQQSSERLRKLQSEMEAAKRLMQMVVQREQMRKEALQLEWDIFEKRCTVKTVKRKLGVKGEDEDLVAHKKKKVEEQPQIPKSNSKNQQQQATKNGAAAKGELLSESQQATASQAQAQAQAQAQNVYQQAPAYVRLPICKIPDMELTMLEQVTRDKEIAIRTAVKNKLKSRNQQDRDWVNYTDNPFVPYCDYFDPDVEARNNLKVIDPQHACYSSIGAPYPPSCDVPLKLPLAVSLGASYASRVEASPILFKTQFEDDGDLSVVSKSTEKDMMSTGPYNVPRSSAMSLRKRRGRGGRIMIDRRGLIRKPTSFDDDDDTASMMDWEQDSNRDDAAAKERLEDRYKYDSDIRNDNMEFSSNDPSRLNGISNQTQSIRFGSMLLSKSFDTYREAYQQRQHQLMQWQQKQLLQQQQQQQIQEQQQLQEQASNNNSPSSQKSSLSTAQQQPLKQVANGKIQSRPTSGTNTPIRHPNMNGNGNANGNGSANANSKMSPSMKMGTPPTKVEG